MKKNLLKKAAALVLSASMLLSMTASAFAAELENGAPKTDTGTITVTQTGTANNDDLFDQYVEGMFYGGGAQTYASHVGRDGLDAKAGTIYDALLPKIKSIANGDVESTKISNLGISVTFASEDELNAAFGSAVSALLLDCPSEFYWYNKTKTGGASFSYSTSNYTPVEVFFSVAKDYQKNGDPYTTDITRIEAAKQAVKKAGDIAASASGSDADKLKYFKDKICELVSYDTAAASGSTYGDSFQLTNVFDGNTSTNVVCEGYSKAFQYLCELAGIDCYTVTGTMAGGTGAGAHMWNIVRLDGKSYVVDVTNCDDGTIGDPDKLFLKGVELISNGYKVAGVTYTYDNNTKSLINESILTPSTLDYGVKPHEHTYSTEWTSDETNHWHAATCEHTEQISDKAAHTWDEGKVTTQPTETATGEKTYTCTVCKATKTEVIEKLTHTHTFSAEWTSDETNHWHAATCEHNNETKDKAAHTWDEGKVTTQPTETSTGVKTYTCTVCKATKTEVIEKLTHTHTFSEAWSHDETNHWHAATCEHNNETKDKAAHTWDEGKVTTQPTETATGEKTYTCTVCKATKTEVIEKLAHTHTFSAEWTSDDTNHWHAATCEHTEQISDKAAHTWDEGKVTTQPTETATGEKTYTCTVCKATKTEVIEKLTHTHTFSETWSHDDTNHWHAATCEHNNETKDKAAHTWDEGNVTTQPTETATGVKTYTCTVCKATKTEVIEKLAHTHTFSAEWTSDETNHWHAATCEHTEQISDKATHTWDEGKVTTQPTETATGEKTYTCTVCKATKTEVIEKLTHTHTFSEAWSHDETNHWHAATCEHTEQISDKAAHTWDEGKVTTQPTETATGEKTYTCTVCKATKTEVIEKLTHTHTFSTEWTSDDTNHWHAATCEHTDEVKDKAAHTFGAWTITKPATEQETGSQERSCSVCGYKETEIINKLPHSHVPSSDWSHDDSSHWHTCSGCDEKLDLAAHAWNDGVITTQPTEDAEGVKTYTCLTCGRTKTEPVAKLDHTHSPSDDWTTDGSSHWHTCSGCDEKLDFASHVWNDGEITTQPTEDAEGVKTYTCGTCNRTKTEPVSKLPHTHELKLITAVKPTCAKEGNIEHYHCGKCGKNYSDSEGKNELTKISLPIDSSNHAGGTELRNVKKATCREQGYTGDTYCLGCNKLLKYGSTIFISPNAHSFRNGICEYCGILQYQYIFNPVVTYLNENYHFTRGMARRHTPNWHGLYTNGIYEWYVCGECGHEYGKTSIKIKPGSDDIDSIEIVVEEPVECGDVETITVR